MSTANTPQTGKKRLTTSAMIASIAAEGQATRSAPFGHALAALADQRSDISGPVQVHRPAHFCQGPPGAFLSDGHGRATADERRCGYGP